MEAEKPQKSIKQSLWGKIFQVLITWTVYFLFHPKIIYTDKTLKKRLKNTPCVFVVNHTHHFDGAYGGAVLWRYKPYVLVTKRWFDKPAVGKMISWCRCLSIDLSEADASWFQSAEQIVKGGGSLLIFPEGSLSKNGKINEFKPGAALISAKEGVPIVPCAIYGTYQPVFGMRQKIIIGEPIPSECPENIRHSKYARQLIAKAHDEVERLFGVLCERYGGKGNQYLQYAENVNNGEEPNNIKQ